MYPHTDATLTADLARVTMEERVRAAEARRTARQVARADRGATVLSPELTPFPSVVSRGIWRLLTRRQVTA